VDQVALVTGEDLASLHELDPKLWIALSMPTRGVELDARTLDLLDTDRDGFVRHPEILAVLEWLGTTCKHLGQLYSGGETVDLDHLRDGPVLASARRVLAMLGKPDAKTISLADTTDAEKLFANTIHDGDGVIPPAAVEGEARQVMEDIITTCGSVPGRTGTPGVDAAKLDAFFGHARDLVAWRDRVDASLLVAGDATAAAADAVRAVRAKLDDYFTRCSLAAFDARAAVALAPAEAELAALSTRQLSATSPEVEQLPLARIAAGAALPLTDGINPAWLERIRAFTSAAITPILGERDELSEADWRRLGAALAPYEAWRADQPATALRELPIDRVRAALAHEAAVRAALEADLAVKPEVDAIEQVEKLCRCQRDLVALLENYVNFSRFYGKKAGIFQAGTLYLDGRGCHLTFEVTDVARHQTMAAMAGTYLAYCECTRAGGAKKTIAAAFTSGSVDNVFVGRNGVFVDRKGVDWQCTITKVIDNPISVRQAFWSPYKKFVRAVEERVAKRAADAEVDTAGKLDTLATDVSRADKQLGGKPPAAKKPGIDVGTVAALGVAVGGIAAVLTAILAGVFGLGPWAPLGVLGIGVAISAPSMLLAYVKLRRRNLGPLLDAGGWAINALTRINVPFGTTLTDRATLPANAQRELSDPYAERRRPWRLYLALSGMVLVGGLWYFGKLDTILPKELRSVTVLGERAPAHPDN
jgi:hypothetical protein